MLRRTLLACPALLAAPFAAPSAARAQGAAIPVVASFTILADLAREVAGPRAEIRAIAGPEADAHAFQPRPSDAASLRGASLLLRNGLGFDGWFDRLARAAAPGARLVTATAGLEPRTMEGHDHGHNHGAGTERRQSGRPRRVADPHAWQDVRLAARIYVPNIAQGLAAADPDRAAQHLASGEAYAARLTTLDAWVGEQVATVPPARRRVITSHDAFGYFGAAYGIQFFAPQGVSTAAEPSAQQVAALIRQIRAERITAVFVEHATNPATLERLAREAGVSIRGRLYADTLSPPGGPAATYEAMVRHNVALMVDAMRGGA